MYKYYIFTKNGKIHRQIVIKIMYFISYTKYGKAIIAIPENKAE